MEGYEHQRRELLSWAGCSMWLAQAIRELDARDPVNAAHDVARLLALQQQRMAEALDLPATRAPLPERRHYEPPALLLVNKGNG